MSFPRKTDGVIDAPTRILTRLGLQEVAVDGAGGAGHVGQRDLPQESVGKSQVKHIWRRRRGGAIICCSYPSEGEGSSVFRKRS